MKLRLLIGFTALVLLASVTSLAHDKDTGKNGNVRHLTGCLQQGDSSNEFNLTAKDGSTWEVRPADGVNLAPHVGHTVAITGTRSTLHAKAHEAKEKTKDEASEHGMAKDSTEHGHLKVTKVSMVSNSCTP